MFEPENEYYIWAAGTYGRRLISFLRKNAPNMKICAFIDNDPKKHGKKCHGLPVTSWEEARPHVPRRKIIIALAVPTQVRNFLLEQRYKENNDFFFIFAFLPRYFWEIQKKIVPCNVSLLTNNNCVCNCDGCSAYVPYVKKAFVSSLESLTNTANLAFAHIDKCMTINLCGGETLLNKNIADFCVYLSRNIADKFDNINLVTSGIVIPSDEDMEKFACANIELSISDYTQTDKRAAENLPLLIEKCRKFGVYHFINQHCHRELWFDVGNPYAINIADPDELKACFGKCFKLSASCLDGKLFACIMQHWRWLATGISEPRGDDAFDLHNSVTEQSRKELYRIISRQPELGYHTGCAHCGGTFTPYLK